MLAEEEIYLRDSIVLLYFVEIVVFQEPSCAPHDIAIAARTLLMNLIVLFLGRKSKGKIMMPLTLLFTVLILFRLMQVAFRKVLLPLAVCLKTPQATFISQLTKKRVASDPTLAEALAIRWSLH